MEGIMRFEGKVAIVTGGSEGMGKAAATGFAKEGASVVITSRSQQKLDAAVQEIKAAGGKNVIAIAGDVTSSEAIRNVVAGAVKEYGKVDILFNYVGGEPDLGKMTPFIEQNEEYWRRMIDLNLVSTINYCHAVLGGMIKQKYGKIVNTAAIAGRIASPNMVLYSSVKGGIIAFTRSLALEVAEYNINVNCVSPGPVNTPGFSQLFGKEKALEGTKELAINKRVGKPEDVGNAAIYLASDEAGFITGQTLAVDGGRTMI
jgi:2-hydroxycyclohexanecarboxyl-CoA dehydrogenase